MLLKLIAIIAIQLTLFHHCAASEFCPMNRNYMSYMHAEIYFIPWRVLTRTRQSPDDIKKNKDFYLRIQDYYIKNILNSMKSIKFNKYDGNGGDARFVMDLHKSDGTILTYYSDGTFMYLSEPKCYGKITSEFFSALDFFKK